MLTPGIATRLSSGEVTKEPIRYEQHQIRTSETNETASDGVLSLSFRNLARENEKVGEMKRFGLFHRSGPKCQIP